MNWIHAMNIAIMEAEIMIDQDGIAEYVESLEEIKNYLELNGINSEYKTLEDLEREED